jgi:hypothetical protein
MLQVVKLRDKVKETHQEIVMKPPCFANHKHVKKIHPQSCVVPSDFKLKNYLLMK